MIQKKKIMCILLLSIIYYIFLVDLLSILNYDEQNHNFSLVSFVSLLPKNLDFLRNLLMIKAPKKQKQNN